MAVNMTVPGQRPSVRRAESLLARGEAAEAELMLRWLVKQQPRDAAAWHLLSVIANGTGRADKAIEFATNALALDDRRAEFHFALGRALKSAQRLAEAVQAYERALRLRPAFAEVHVSLGIALRLLGRLDAAAACHREALRLRPNFPEALANLGNVLAERLGQQVGDSLTAEDLREAEQVHRQAVALAPSDPVPLHNLAIVLRITGRYSEAATLFNRALALDARRVDTCLQFGALLVEDGRLDLARKLYTQWLGGQPQQPDVMLALAACLADLGESGEAVEWLDRVEQLAPGLPRTRHQRARIEQRVLRVDLDAAAALAGFRAAIDARPDYVEAVCAYLMTLGYLEHDPSRLLQEHRARIAPVLAAAREPALPPAVAVHKPGRLRVGLVSQDFERHSVAYFIEGLLEARDRTRHEVFAYKSNAGGDDVTARLRASCDHWIEVGALSDAQLARRCRADGIDVLVDLSGLTSGSRIGVFARRAAPCQVTYLGYPTTTGADCFDFRFTDATIDPPGSDAFSSEPLLRLPGGMFCYRPGAAPPVGPLPAAARGRVTFGSFNNFSKAGEATLRLWLEVLLAVPGSHLRLKAQAFMQGGNREVVAAWFDARGVARERIEFQSHVDDVQAHLACYAEVDIALDTIPFNGATTTCEALHMGVPVVALAGATHPGRMGASVLAAAGLSHLVANDGAGYVRIAVALAGDLARLAQTRAGLRTQLQASRLMDKAGFARDFEQALELAFEACASRDGAGAAR